MLTRIDPRSVVGALALAGLLACGGADSSKPQPASTLTYQAPTASSYRLEASPSSTPTQLVLNLMGPTGAKARGVTVHLSCDGQKAAWVAPSGATGLVKPGAVFDLGTGTPLFVGKASGQELDIALFQKGGTPAATLAGQPICTVALNLRPGIAPGDVMLAVRPGCQVLDEAGTTSSIAVAVGRIVAQ
jgi:hypothetical protein